MLGDAVEFPARGERALATLLVGGMLSFLAASLWTVGVALSVVLVGLFVLPFALVASALLRGYRVAVLRSCIDGSGEPPEFVDWSRLFADGLSGLFIGVVYGLPIVALACGFVLTLVTADLVLTGATAEAALTATTVLFLAAIGLSLLVYSYIEPIALAVYARGGRIGPSFSPRAIGRVALRPVYLIAWLLAALVALVGYSLAVPLAPLLVGFGLLFYLAVVRDALYGTGIARALSETEPERATSEGSIADSGFTPATSHVVDPGSRGTVVPEATDSDEESEGVSAPCVSDTHDERERDWPDWDPTER